MEKNFCQKILRSRNFWQKLRHQAVEEEVLRVEVERFKNCRFQILEIGKHRVSGLKQTKERTLCTSFKKFFSLIFAVVDLSLSSTCPEHSWTTWYDRDNPSGNCDCELLSELRKENLGQICENPTEVEARLVSSKQPYTSNQANIVFNTEVGLACWNNGNQNCDDYEVRFCCPPKGEISCNVYYQEIENSILHTNNYFEV